MITGTAIAAVILVLLLPTLREQAAVPAAPAVAAPNGAPPPLTGTPRQQADQLFNRVMEERQAGNVERVTFFLPMAIAAYRQAGQLDADGLYHLSLLESAAGQHGAARATAEQILAQSPGHLLGLAAAAEAAARAGDTTAAKRYYERFLEDFASESTRRLPEYQDHARIFPEYRQSAEALLGRSGS